MDNIDYIPFLDTCILLFIATYINDYIQFFSEKFFLR